MNEELAKKALEYLEGAEQIAVKQGPKIIEEILNFYTAYYGSGLFLGLFLGGVAIYLIYQLIHNVDHNKEERKAGIYIFVSVFSGVSSCIMTPLNFINFVKVWLAPRLFLIEYFRDFLS